MKRKMRRSALALLAVLALATATMGFGPRAQAHDLVSAAAEGTSALADIVVATTRLVTVPVFFVLGLHPHPVVHPQPVPVAVAPVGPPRPFAVATPVVRPMYGGYYAQ
ncbi:MAG: hypothetical protein HW380_2517 [Magnetococcales bacterium]|nr:hypothetical protein [Magnetococcales bacterium]HIJ84372.1 hypothetical protein [Magnetococcales bacterium]